MSAVERVIVGYDGTEHSADALALGRELALATKTTLLVARAGPENGAPGLDAVASSLGEVHAEALELIGDSPAKALHELAAASPEAILVLGASHRSGLGQMMRGSVVEPMLQGSPCPVAVAPRGLARSEYGLRVLAVAFDDSAEARAALELAGELALGASATVRVIGVLDAGAGPEGAASGVQQAAASARGHLRDAIHDAAAGLPREVRALPVVCHGGPVPELLSQCEQGVDLLVMGSRGYGPLRSVLLGSTSSMMIRAARCPVIVVPRPRRRAAPGGAEAQPPA